MGSQNRSELVNIERFSQSHVTVASHLNSSNANSSNENSSNKSNKNSSNENSLNENSSNENFLNENSSNENSLMNLSEDDVETLTNDKQKTSDEHRGLAPPPLPPPRIRRTIGEAVKDGVAVRCGLPPLLPRRNPIARKPNAQIRRPALEPRSKAEQSLQPTLAGIHSLTSSHKRNRLMNAADMSIQPLVANRTVIFSPKSPVSSMVILRGGRTMTIVDVFSPEPEERTRGGASLGDDSVIQRWSTRSRTSDQKKRLNEYVDSPTLGRMTTTTTTRVVDLSSASRDTTSTGIGDTDAGRGRDELKKSEFYDEKKLKEVASCKERIICSRCNRCRCVKCTELHDLPSRWVGKRECSASTAVDCCTCMCCVRAVFYHCAASTDESDCSDEPCGCCDRPRCCARWAVVGALSLCLPCLCCYWPLRCLVGACNVCYNGCCRVQGCRCQRDVRTP